MSHARVDGMTAPELAAHLAEMVDDEEFILKAVRLKFPQYGLAGESHTGSRQRLTADQARENIKLSKADYRQRAHRKPSQEVQVPWHESATSRNAEREMVENGSRTLLHTLHREHHAILKHLASNGRMVVYP